ncbi:expressed unknown protein [Seminavis robusta]|uniref:G-protein coupled receptors family 3 profile domain-containing protein n=1 Tax=Seminavis robusta TaxID=568900 RepID=A0A9N8ECN4_9STRA|nr:expressed unknown protein [Seminavis robusta]|eukprot:Sro928_g221270.1 n/a (892) ;mRNA; r:32043-34843
MMIPLLLLVLLHLLVATTVAMQEFSSVNEVAERVKENSDHFMSLPKISTALTTAYYQIHGFPHNLPDRSAALRFLYSQAATLQASVFISLEDGTLFGYNAGFGSGTYREPGNSGYYIPPTTTNTANSTSQQNENEFYKHWISCVNGTSGEPLECQQADGDFYIEWVDNGQLQPCRPLDVQTEEHCHQHNSTSEEELQECLSQVLYCYSYDVKKANFSSLQLQDDNTAIPVDPNRFGYVPRTYSCTDQFGQFSEDHGQVLQDFQTGALGDCTFADGTTLVHRGNMPGDYAYCGDDDDDGDTICNDTFLGGYRSRDYDPRWRTWYADVKRRQRPEWSAPYAFFNTLKMGISFSEPFYSTHTTTGTNNGTQQQKKVFEGIVVADYTLEQFGTFLVGAYGDKDIHVAIFENAPPHHYLIAASTGAETAKQVLASDHTQPCPSEWYQGGFSQFHCDVVRVPMETIDEQNDNNDNDNDDDSSTNNNNNNILKHAFERLKQDNFPQNELIAFKDGPTNAYVVQAQSYEQPNANLNWFQIIVMPMEQYTSDSIVPGEPMFVALCMVSLLGFACCCGMLLVSYCKRHERSFAHTDWRFQVAFIFGCCLLNLSTLTFIGEASDELCLARMWTTCLCFSLALSTLFVKCWRMFTLVRASRRFRRTTITNVQAAVRALPMIGIQTIILLVFTIVDPPRRTENLQVNGGSLFVQPWQHILCQHETDAFHITQFTFMALVVAIGCYLAYQSRYVGEHEYSHAENGKPLALAMYNIAFAGAIIGTILFGVDMSRDAQMLMAAFGVFWGTVFSSSIFVIPRYIHSVKGYKSRRSNFSFPSGLDTSARASGHHNTSGYVVKSREETKAREDDEEVAPDDNNNNNGSSSRVRFSEDGGGDEINSSHRSR